MQQLNEGVFDEIRSFLQANNILNLKFSRLAYR